MFHPDHKRALSSTSGPPTWPEKRRERQRERDESGEYNAGAQFFTDDRGRVHPIRASLREKPARKESSTLPEWAKGEF